MAVAGKRGRERERNAHREVWRGVVDGRERGGGDPLSEREREIWNLKTLFYKDCSLGSFKNLSNN